MTTKKSLLRRTSKLFFFYKKKNVCTNEYLTIYRYKKFDDPLTIYLTKNNSLYTALEAAAFLLRGWLRLRRHVWIWIGWQEGIIRIRRWGWMGRKVGVIIRRMRCRWRWCVSLVRIGRRRLWWSVEIHARVLRIVRYGTSCVHVSIS